MAKHVTPHEKYPALAKAIGLKELYLKREDLHPYGSHKGRSVPVMIDKYRAEGDRHFAISSSGNAALAAAIHVHFVNDRVKSENDMIELDIFVGNHVAPHKLAKVKELAEKDGPSKGKIRVLAKERPVQALTQAIEEGARSLRQSMDDSALIGYESLSAEIADISKGKGAVFIGTSSGTTAQALASYFLEKKLPIQVHIIQTSSCHPIALAFDSFETFNERSIADAIVDITAHRKEALVPLIKETGGRGWCASNENIRTAQSLVSKHAGLDISTNSALSVVGAMQAAYMGYEFEGPAICVVCGE